MIDDRPARKRRMFESRSLGLSSGHVVPSHVAFSCEVARGRCARVSRAKRACRAVYLTVICISINNARYCRRLGAHRNNGNGDDDGLKRGDTIILGTVVRVRGLRERPTVFAYDHYDPVSGLADPIPTSEGPSSGSHDPFVYFI